MTAAVLPRLAVRSLSLLFLTLHHHAVVVVDAGLVLSDHIMALTVEAAKLSMLAYEETQPDDTVTHDYATFGYHDAEPDQALTVQTSDDHCFVAFRGTSLTFDDWSQNLKLGTEDLCIDVALGGTKECCTSRVGFYDAYNTPYRNDVEDEVRKCAATCQDKDDCVVITGHSQGGAIAAVAAVFLADLNPYVITFGQPPTLDAPCDLLTTDRIFRYVNTKQTSVGIAYDPVPMAPGLGADHFGNMIVLGDDPTGVAFIGLDARDFLKPYLNGIEAHFMTGNGKYPGYADRIHSLTAPNATYPIRNNGFVPGSLCSVNEECESKVCGKEHLTSWKRCVGMECEVDDDCDTDRCDSGVCLSKATSCMECDEDNDCAGDTTMCLLYKCSNEFGLMDNNCICRTGDDCDSGRCEGTFPRPMCQAKLADGGSCNEGSDCISGLCSWSFTCEKATTVNKLVGGLVWFLIVVAALAVIYGLYLCFCRKGKNGYTEISSAEHNINNRTTKRIVVFTIVVAGISIALFLTATHAFRPSHLLSQSAIPQSELENASILQSPNQPLEPSEDALFFPELQWENLSDGQYYGALEFCSDGNATFAYGLLGNCVPGQPAPLLRMKPNHHFHLTLVNNAHIDTNLHTHGLHVSGVGTVDDVTRNVEPGFCLQYDFFIVDDADVGTFWYHPHRHPLVSLEAFGGAYGMLIVDEIIEDYYPPHLDNFLKRNEVLLQFSSLYNKLVSHIRHNRVNGLQKLNLALDRGVFYFFRVSSVVYTESVNWIEFFPSNACTSQPVAYDGVYRSEIPHPNSSHTHMMSVSSRLDLAVRCNENAELHFHQGDDLTDKSHMVQILVSEPASSRPSIDSETGSTTFIDAHTIRVSTSLPSSPYWDANEQTYWNPRRPYYMPDLNSPDSEIDETWNVSMDDYFLDGTKGFSINQVTWDPDKPIRDFSLGQLAEWKLQRTQTHPFHAHINRMLIVQPGGCGYGRFEEGQYYDTIAADIDECKVRTKFYDYSGRIVIHCHRFGHEDLRMQTWLNMTGGQDDGVMGALQVDCLAVP